MTLSILIRSIDRRKDMLSDLICDLILQCGIIKKIYSFDKLGCSILFIKFDSVEIIVAIDDKKITSGAKANVLLSLAENDYVLFVDDDDVIYPYFVSEIFKAIQYCPDCVGTKGLITTDGSDEIEWRLSKDYANVTINENRKKVYLRTTNHLSPVRRDFALQAGFPEISNGEDKAYSDKLNPFLKTEIKIDKLMYHYRFNSKIREY